MIERAVCPTMVGRQDELSALEDALLEVCLGRGRVVVVAGEAGVGKSRLAAELARQAARLDSTVLWGSCSEAGLAVPYLPVLEALGNHLAGTDVTALRARLGPAARELGRVFPQLGDDAVGGGAGDPVQAKLRFFEAVLSLLGVLAAEQAVLLVVEDLHWADPSTHELIDYLARRIQASPILLLATYRVEEMDRRHPLHPTLQGWRRSRVADTVALSSLQPGEVAEMVSAIFDEADVGAQLRDDLHGRSEGNPFVIEEILKAALENGDILRTEAGWGRRSIAELHLPDTVRDTILGRVERLTPAQREGLRTAAVIGSSFDLDVLAELCADSVEAIDAAMHDCVRQQFVEEQGNGYRFRHSLTWEAIYADMSGPQRSRLHGRIAAVLQARGAPAADVARHLAGANRHADAVPLWISAAERAMQEHAYADAAELYRRAVDHAGDPLLRARILGAMGNALWCAGPTHTRRAVEPLRACVEGLEAAGEMREAAARRLLLGRCHNDLGEGAPARACYQQVRAVLEAEGPSQDLATVYLNLSFVEASMGHWEAMAALAQRAIDTATAAAADLERIWAYARLGKATVELGRVQEGFALLERSYREAIEQDFDIVAFTALNSRIDLLFEMDRAAEAGPFIARLQELPEGFGPQKGRAWSALVATVLGPLGEACRGLQAALDAGWIAGKDARFAQLQLAWGLTEMGRETEARALRISSESQADPYEGIFEAIALARYHLAAGTPEAALPEVAQLLDSLDGLPPPGMSFAELPEATVAVFLATGRRDRAAEVVAQLAARGTTTSSWSRRARARLLLADGHAAEAQAIFTALADEFAAAGYRIAETETRLLAADALLELDDVDRAAWQIRTALAVARECEAVRMAERATSMLRALGYHDAEAPASPATQPSRGDGRATAARGGRIACVVANPAASSTALDAQLRNWAQRMAARRRAARVDVDGLGGRTIAATFDGSADGRDCCRTAIEMALTMHGKACLAGVALRIAVAVGNRGQAPMALAHQLAGGEGDGVVASAPVVSEAEPWLGELRVSAVPVTVDGGRDGPITAYMLRRQGALPASGAARPASRLDGGETVAANTFRRDGEYWTIAFRERVIRLRDSKGLRDLLTLLSNPGVEVAAVDLVSGGTAAPESDVGPALDDEARRQYRERLVDLEDDIGSAEMANDPERAARAREEREFLLAELGAAVGLGGRGRRLLDPAERARKTVTWRIRDSIARIAGADRMVGEHFRRSVRTGTFCVYDPAEPTAWSL
jgi:tetratricopeptide (TPR) repeat protein